MRLFLAWILLGLVLVAAAAVPPVNRTQEARVLETAREMIGRPAEDWLIPKLNGHVRLRKPPLAYWASAGAMSLFGPNECAGRLPTVLVSWLSVGATFAVARRWFNPRVALYSAGALAGSWLFFKHGMLAETDAYAAAGMTIGIWAIVRASEARPGRDIGWLHAVAVCLAAIVLAKGPPAAYLLLFWVGWCAVRRDWTTLTRFLTRGAVVTLLVVAVPWFAYVKTHTAADGQLGADLANSADGGDHPGPPWAYVPMLIKATVPWTGVWAVALVMAGTTLWGALRAKSLLGTPSSAFQLPDAAARAADSADDPEALDGASASATDPQPAAARGNPLSDGRDARSLLWLAIWGGAVLLPLCMWGNKQFHYLLPAMAPTMILVGWALGAATQRDARGRAAFIVTMTTGMLLAFSPLVLVVAITQLRSSVRWYDFVLVAALAVAEAAVARAYRKGGLDRALPLFLGLTVLLMLAIHAWLPAVLGGRSRLAALDLLKQYPEARFVFRATELPVMSWSMRRAVPGLDDAAITAAADANLVVLDQQQDGEASPAPPAGFKEAEAIRQGDNTLHVFVPLPRR